MKQFSRTWVLAVMVGLLLVLAGTSSAAGVMGRKTFRATDDNNRNFVTLESDGQLQTIFALTTALTTMADVRLDTIQDAPQLQLTVDLTKMTTGYPDLNATVFSPSFLDLGKMGTLTFQLTGFERSRAWVLSNEQKIEVTGTGQLTINGKTNNIVIDVFLTYLQENEITKGRMPGDLLHLTGGFNFHLADYGIEIPQEALLKINDLVRIHFDIFGSTLQ